MIGVVDVGGGLRGVYGAGVFDTCLDEGIAFDYLIGVSAGSANVASFLAGQKGRNLKFYADYSFRKAYMSFRNLLRRGSYLDLDYIYGDALTNAGGEYPLDYQAMAARPETAKIVATDVATGQPVYFDFHDMAQDDYGAIKASCCVPVVNRPYRWRGKAYYDGGLSDPIPFQQAFQAGCDRVVVILTRPKDYYRDPKKDQRMAKLLPKYPNAARVLQPCGRRLQPPTGAGPCPGPGGQGPPGGPPMTLGCPPPRTGGHSHHVPQGAQLMPGHRAFLAGNEDKPPAGLCIPGEIVIE